MILFSVSDKCYVEASKVIFKNIRGYTIRDVFVSDIENIQQLQILSVQPLWPPTVFSLLTLPWVKLLVAGLTAETSPCGIFGVQSVTGRAFSPSTSVLFCRYILPVRLTHSFVTDAIEY